MFFCDRSKEPKIFVNGKRYNWVYKLKAWVLNLFNRVSPINYLDLKFLIHKLRDQIRTQKPESVPFTGGNYYKSKFQSLNYQKDFIIEMVLPWEGHHANYKHKAR